jgi:hypothetical protein
MDLVESLKRRPLAVGALALFSLIALGASLLTAPGTHSGAGAHPASGASAPHVGSPVTAGNWKYTVLASRRTDHLDGGFGTHAKGEYVLVELELENIGRENFGLHDWDFELYDAAGVRYRADTASDFAWRSAMPGEKAGAVGLDSGQLPPFVAGKYIVGFDVTPGAQGLRLRLVQAGVDVPL